MSATSSRYVERLRAGGIEHDAPLGRTAASTQMRATSSTCTGWTR